MMWLVVLVVVMIAGAAAFLWYRIQKGAGLERNAPVQLVITGTPHIRTDRAFDHVDLFLDGQLKAQWDELPPGDHELGPDVVSTVNAAVQSRALGLSIRVDATKDGAVYDFTMDLLPSRVRGRAIASSFSEPYTGPRTG